MNVYDLPPRGLSARCDQDSRPVVDFSLEAMAVMDLPTFVRGRTSRTLGIWARMRGAQASVYGDQKPGGIELLSGLPRTLLDIFASIEDDSAETAFLAWPGDVGEAPFCHLWEAYRVAGILVSRRLHRFLRDAAGTSPPPCPLGPSADVLVNRLIAALDALCDAVRRAEHSDILAANSIFYPYVAARLEVAVLQRHDSWIDTLRLFQRRSRPYGATENARVVEKMLDEAYNTSNDMYDIDKQARSLGVEMAMF